MFDFDLRWRTDLASIKIGKLTSNFQIPGYFYQKHANSFSKSKWLHAKKVFLYFITFDHQS